MNKGYSMQIYTNMAPLELGGKEGSAVALGYFDGIHVGHQTVIGGAVSWAKAHGAAAALFTFKLPGASKIKGRRLFSIEDKRRIVAGLGVEHYLVPAFADIQAMTPEQFVYGLVADCQARAFFCGENFTFGAKAAGDPALLRALCAPLGVEVHVMPMARYEGKPVSSTRIRAALEGGDTRPTVNTDESKVTCETFIPGFSGDLYGADPVVEFFVYLSPSKKFAALDELRDCIQDAARRAQEYRKRSGSPPRRTRSERRKAPRHKKTRRPVTAGFLRSRPFCEKT